ncbi:MAG: Gfo/Idh/MocA family oxidoreductase, partial [Sedimentisphaerales bacterium]|nr:Gfo/Idh/MocA family oxidoreductase [Sedimentisphaerales bacterium]
MSAKVRTAVIGAGRMGKLHTRIYSQMEQVELIGVVDRDNNRSGEIAGEYGTQAFADLSEVIDKVDAVTISVPTEHHFTVAKPFLEKGIAVLVEKPLADSLPIAREMLELSRKNNCILQVGYSERFNPVAQAMKRLNFKPRFIESNRISPFTSRSTDIGVVLDMMIHDIDIILSLAKSPIKSVSAAGVNVIGKHE